jgi:hypothetical protein
MNVGLMPEFLCGGANMEIGSQYTILNIAKRIIESAIRKD